jgi:hypothetical protein
LYICGWKGFEKEDYKWNEFDQNTLYVYMQISQWKPCIQLTYANQILKRNKYYDRLMFIVPILMQKYEEKFQSKE